MGPGHHVCIKFEADTRIMTGKWHQTKCPLILICNLPANIFAFLISNQFIVILQIALRSALGPSGQPASLSIFP